MPESAIPPHLQKPRTCPMSMPHDYVPPVPAYCARFPTAMSNLVMAIIGIQYSSKDGCDTTGVRSVQSFIAKPLYTVRPSSWELTSTTDKRGYYNVAFIAYWSDSSLFEEWKRASGFDKWWQDPDREIEGCGWYQEVLKPSIERFETVFSNNKVSEGAAKMQENISDPVNEHNYWGSMRDRLAAAQDDRLPGEKASPGKEAIDPSRALKEGKRITIPCKKNLCVIRSGQDWSASLPAEREMYLATMHPVLTKGMTYLRDEGQSIGCYTNNLWDVIDPSTFEAGLEKTYGLAFFDDMSSLEYWSKSHQTHIDIFGGFMMYAKKLGNELRLRLYHEVYVLEEGQQFFEYINCHSETGMLNSIGPGKSTLIY